jgi:hypothetical protein
MTSLIDEIVDSSSNKRTINSPRPDILAPIVPAQVPIPEMLSQTIRLDEPLGTEISDFCREHKISTSTLLEAMYLSLKGSGLMSAIASDARNRSQERIKRGRKQAAATMTKNLS